MYFELQFQDWTSIVTILVRDAFVRTNRNAVAMMFVCLYEMGVHCDHAVQFLREFKFMVR